MVTIPLMRADGTIRSWGVRCTTNGQRVFLGYFKQEAEAIAMAMRFRAEHMPYSPEARAK